MARPWDDRVISEVRFVTGREVSPYAAVRGALLRAVGEAYEERARGAALWCGRACASGEPHLAAVLAGGRRGGDEAELIPDAEIVIEVDTDGLPPPAREDGAPLVLVVDDEPEIRQLVQRMLASKGYAVALAVDGAGGARPGGPARPGPRAARRDAPEGPRLRRVPPDQGERADAARARSS